MKLLDKRTAQALLTALLFGLVLLFIYAAWRIIIAFLFAIFFANLLEAPVARLERLLRGSRNAAIANRVALNKRRYTTLRPAFAWGQFLYLYEPRGPQRRARLVSLCVGDTALVSHRSRSSPCSAVKH